MNLNNPIIFLDMDGVMNNDRAFQRSKKGFHPPGNLSAHTVSHLCVEHLNILMDKTNSDIVISSSWRSKRKMDDMDLTFEFGNITVIRALSWGGFKHCNRIIGNTIELDDEIRGKEIEHWLENHKDRFSLNETPFIILDDDGDMTENQLLNNFVQPNRRLGLQQSDINKALKLIERQRLSFI